MPLGLIYLMPRTSLFQIVSFILDRLLIAPLCSQIQPTQMRATGLFSATYCLGGGTALTYRNSGGLRIFDNKFPENQIGIDIPSDNASLRPVLHQAGIISTASIVNGIRMTNTVPSSFITDWSISNNYFNNMPTGDFIKIDAGANFIARGVISANYFIQNPTGTGKAINLIGAVSALAITGNEITTGNDVTAVVISAGAGVTGSFVGNDMKFRCQRRVCGVGI